MAADLTLQEILKSPIHYSCFAGLCQLHGHMQVLTLLREIDAYTSLPRSAREARALSILKDIGSSVASSPEPDKFFQLVGCSSSTDISAELMPSSPARSQPLFALPQQTYDLIVARVAQRDFSPHLFVDVRKLLGDLLDTEVLPIYIRYRNDLSKNMEETSFPFASTSDSAASDEDEAYWRKSLRNLKFWKKRSPPARARSTLLTGSEGRIPSSSMPPAMVFPQTLSLSTPRTSEISSKSLSQIFESTKSRTSSNENSPSTAENSNSPQSSIIRSRSRSVEFPESDGDPDDLSRFLIFRSPPTNLEFEFCTRRHQHK